MFCGKRRVVLMKRTCRFVESEGSFLMHDGKRKKTMGETELKNGVCGKVKIHIITPFARTRTRVLGVFVFLLSQVSQGCW